MEKEVQVNTGRVRDLPYKDGQTTCFRVRSVVAVFICRFRLARPLKPRQDQFSFATCVPSADRRHVTSFVPFFRTDKYYPTRIRGKPARLSRDQGSIDMGTKDQRRSLLT